MENLAQINKQTFSSRSAILAHFTCPYKYYLTYEAEGSGFTSEKQSLDLLIGSVVHRGLQHLFEHCRKHKPDEELSEACVDEAVKVARNLWEDELIKRSLWLHSGEEDRLDWIITEQETLWEGMIRAFAIYRLPDILEEYEILEVEHEEVYEISPGIMFLGKADGLFLRKADNKLIILSIKTTSEYADVTTRDILHDMQGVSEWFLVQERLNKWYDLCLAEIASFGISDRKAKELNITSELRQYFQYCYNNKIKPTIFAVQYEYLIKGQRKQDPYRSGIYKQFSFLCHPLKLDSMLQIGFGSGGGVTIDPAKYKWKWGSGKYPKGWNKEDIWNDIGIKAWVEMLAGGQIQSEEGHPFQSILVTPDLIVRSEKEIEEWLVSTKFKLEQIKLYVEEINSLKEKVGFSETRTDFADQARLFSKLLQEDIWKYFSKNTKSCHNYYGKDCTFVRHCHELQSVKEMQEAGELIRRKPHHELELNALKEKGLVEDE